jgi:hypothetical protein
MANELNMMEYPDLKSPGFNVTASRFYRVGTGSLSEKIDPYVAELVKCLTANPSRKCIEVVGKSKLNVDGTPLAEHGLTEIINLLKDQKTDDKCCFKDWFEASGETELFKLVRGQYVTQKPGYNASVQLKEQPIMGYLVWDAFYRKKLKSPGAISNYITAGVEPFDLPPGPVAGAGARR